MQLVKIKAYEYQELNEKAKEKFIHDMYEMPFDYEEEDENGEYIMKYEYFADWELADQIDFCKQNEYLFDKDGNIINQLIVEEKEYAI